MKMRTILFGLFIFGCETGFPQSLPYLHNVTIITSTWFDSTTQMYFYSYSLINHQNNEGDIWRFEVDISRNPHSFSFDTTGLIFVRSWMESAFRRHYPSLSSRIVPIGFPNLPQLWRGGITSALTAVFSVDTLMPTPGQSVSGLVMMSKGLPGVRNCTVLPNFEEGDLYPDIEEVNDPDSLVAVMKQDREAVNYHGLTVGPYAPPATFNALTFLDTITSYINQSRTLGWIANDPTANKYRRLIDTARFHLEANNRGVSKAKLDSVLVNVSPDSAAGLITSEAYALIRFNTEYVLKKLREEER